MATILKYVQGTGTGSAVGEASPKVYQAVIDVAKLYTDGYTASDTFKVFTVPAGTLINYLDIQILNTLANVTNVSVGHTASGTEYMTAETDTAIGPFTDYENDMPSVLDETGANGYKPRRVTTAEGVFLTLGALGSTSSGKIAFTLQATDLKQREAAKPHVYAR